MELGATMELRVGRDSQLKEEDTPFIAVDIIQPLSTYPARDMRYYRKATRYYREGPWYFRDSSGD